MSITNNNAVAKVAAAVAGAGLVLSSFAFVAPAQADTQTDLQNQINALLAQIQSLQAQLGQGSASTGAQFTRDLTIGSTGADVTELQTWLISKGYSIPAGATGYFGTQTQAAVAAFQAANGITPAAGYFGPITRAKVNSMLSAGGSTGGTTGGGTLSGGEATLSNYDLTSGDTVAEGDTGVEIASAKFDVRGGDVNVGRVTVEVQATDDGTPSSNPWLYFDRLYVYDGNTKVGSVDAGSRDDWDSNSTDTSMNSSGANDYTVDIPVSDIVKMDDTAELTIKADAQNTIDSDNESQTFTLRIPTDGIRAVDAAGIQEYTGSNTDKVTVDFNGQTSGKLTLSEASDDPDAGILVADDNQATTDLNVFNFNLKNTQDGNSLIDSIDLTVATGAPSGSPAADITDIIRKATLTVDGHDYDGDINTDNTITFDLNNDNVVVDGNDTQEFEVTIDLASQSGHYADSGESLTFSVDNTDVSAEGEKDGKNTTVTGSANGNTQTIALNGGIAVAGNSTNAAETYNSNDPTKSTGTFTVKFDVTAVGDDVYVPKAFEANASTTSWGASTGVAMITDLVGSTTSSSISKSLSSTADTDSDNSAFWVVNAGDTETFTAQATIDPTGQEYLQAGITLIRFTTDSSGSDLVTLDIDQNSSDFQTDQLLIHN